MISSVLYSFLTLLNPDIQNFKDSNLTQSNFYFENDVFFQTDRYYTNGTKLEWIFNNSNYLYNLAIKQDIYTPRDHKIGYLDSSDMKYSGIFEFIFGKNKIKQNSLYSVNFGVGISGKYSYAKESMEFIHCFGF